MTAGPPVRIDRFRRPKRKSRKIVLRRAWAADSGSESSRALGSRRCRQTRAAVRPDGRLLAVGADVNLTLWDPQTMTMKTA